MKKIILSAFLATIASGLFSFKAPAVPYHYSDTQTEDYYEYNDCTGEYVTGTITYDYMEHGVINGNKISGGYRGTFHFSGVGETSGQKYVGNESYGGNYNESFNGAYTSSFTGQIHINTAGGGNNFIVREVDKITVNANGIVTVERGEFSTSCQ